MSLMELELVILSKIYLMCFSLCYTSPIILYPYHPPSNATLATNTSYTGPATVLFENREVAVKNGSITDVLMAYGTAAYRFPPISST